MPTDRWRRRPLFHLLAGEMDVLGAVSDAEIAAVFARIEGRLEG